MRTSRTFWALVRHEFRWKGSWRRQNRSGTGRWWRLAYLLLVILIGAGSATYYALQHALNLRAVWFVYLGLPYMMFFWGIGNVKREWENDTWGFWLTLPYPRLWLVAAKWLGTWLQILVVLLAFFLAGTVYVTAISLFLDSYTLADAGRSVIAGLDVLVLAAGFSPAILALGVLAASAQFTVLRPLSPMLWILILFFFGFSYSGLGSWKTGSGLLRQLSGDQTVTWFPYSWAILAAMAASWLAAFLLIRFSAYLFEKKCST